MAAADAMAGRSAGRVTSRKARHRDAPSVRAASSVRGSSPSQSPPTVRTTTARLKKAWASRMAHALPWRSSPMRALRAEERHERRPDHDGREHEGHDDEPPGRSDGPGTRSGPAPGRAGRPSTRVSAVEAAACQRVNQATWRSCGSPSTSPTPDRSHPLVAPQALADDVGTGHSEEARPGRPPARPAGPRPSARRISGARDRSTGRSTPRGCAPMSAGGQLVHVLGRGGVLDEQLRQLDVGARREHEHRQRHVGLHRLGRAGSRSAAAPPARASAPGEDAGALDLPVAAGVDHARRATRRSAGRRRAPRRAGSRRRTPRGGGRPRSPRRRRTPCCRPPPSRRRPARRWRGGRSTTPPSRPRRRPRCWPGGTPGPATRWPGSRPRGRSS